MLKILNVMISKPKALVYVLIGGLIGYLYLQGLFYKKAYNRAQDTSATLEEELNEKVVLTNNLMISLKRYEDGTVKRIRKFVPPEARIVRTVTRKEDGTDGTERITITRRGFTFSPGVGVTFDPRRRTPVVMFSPKFYFWSRLGVIANASHLGLGIGVSRYLDDAFFIWRPKNLEAFISYQPILFNKDSSKWWAGFRITL